MDIRTELVLIPDPRIDRCKKHNLVDICCSALSPWFAG
jgi:hypothetical protein